MFDQLSTFSVYDFSIRYIIHVFSAFSRFVEYLFTLFSHNQAFTFCKSLISNTGQSPNGRSVCLRIIVSVSHDGVVQIWHQRRLIKEWLILTIMLLKNWSHGAKQTTITYSIYSSVYIVTIVKELRSKMFRQHPGYYNAVFLKKTQTIIVSFYECTVYIMF